MSVLGVLCLLEGALSSQGIIVDIGRQGKLLGAIPGSLQVPAVIVRS